MIDTVLRFIRDNQLIIAGDKVLLGVSGGADSTCLLHVMQRLAPELLCELAAVHVHHGLRDKEADQDQQFIENLCKKWSIPFYTQKIDVKELAKRQKLSIEEAARQARYEVFEDYRKTLNAGLVAVAHHLDDNVETMLFQLFRGSGLKGMAGMQPKRDRIIRPLLSIRRREIEAYLQDQKIPYRTDQSNLENEYSRNKIRNLLIPIIEKDINHSFAENMGQASKILREADEYFIDEANLFLSKIDHQDGRLEIPLSMFNELAKPIKPYVLRQAIKIVGISLKDISSHHINEAVLLSSKQVGKRICIPGNIQIKKAYNHLIVEKYSYHDNKEDGDKTDIRTDNNSDIRTDKIDNKADKIDSRIEKIGNRIDKIDYRTDNRRDDKTDVTYSERYIKLKTHQMNMEIVPAIKPLKIPENQYTKWFDYDKINHMPIIRGRQSGDYIDIAPRGKKSIKRFLIDEKVPRELRDEIPLLADGNHILWVVGYRISESVKVSEKTKNILRVSIKLVE